eukprot:scaffold48_cov311-Pinguiococcus_pyrenoidosus.AAC.181
MDGLPRSRRRGLASTAETAAVGPREPMDVVKKPSRPAADLRIETPLSTSTSCRVPESRNVACAVEGRSRENPGGPL